MNKATCTYQPGKAYTASKSIRVDPRPPIENTRTLEAKYNGCFDTGSGSQIITRGAQLAVFTDPALLETATEQPYGLSCSFP